MVLKKTLESPLDSKEIKPVYPKGKQLYYNFANFTLFYVIEDGQNILDVTTPFIHPITAMKWKLIF